LLSITALSLWFKPAEVVPSIFMLEIAASLHLLPGIWKEIHWRSLIPLVIGCLVATPLGVWLLANIPPAPMQVALGLFVLAATALMLAGVSLHRMPGRAASTAVGAASGFANGAFGIGGPPVILFYFATPAGHVAGRASVIAYFLATDIIGLAFQSGEGLVTRDAAIRAVFFLPALVAGVWLGARSFRGASPDRFKRIVMFVLLVMAEAILIKGMLALLPPQ
jgi:uncharacterized membrane protein YfcA